MSERVFNCRFHPTNWWHEVDCPHMEWTPEQLTENEQVTREFHDKHKAPEGQVWVCGACGKFGKNRIDVGDESCFLNAVLCWEKADPTLPWTAATETG